MRKLSKKISMLMVLAMLVGLFSGVVSASAASAWSFGSSKYAVAVNGSINMESKEYADFDLLKDGKEAAGYTVAWASSDEDVVWVNAKTGQLRANKFGVAEDGDKAVISATFTNNATKKSATRSFTIVLGAAKADFTVEAADATIALGEEVKFAPVVKNADGKAVKFATHKSYNGYFLDGKAIANPWTPEEAGEYTVTVAQFAKKADVADLAKAVRKTDVKVTVTVDADFDAKATGVKEITVYGAFAADAKFTVKKDTKQNVSFTATVAEDGKSAKLALNAKLTKGVYTVACGDAKVDLAVEDEKVNAIVVFEKDGEIYTNDKKNEAYVHYDVLNQYGESIRKTCSVDWNSNVFVKKPVDKNLGIITLLKNDPDKKDATETFRYSDTIVLTGVATNYGHAISETVNMKVSLEQSASTVEVIGVVKKGTTEIIKEIPASFNGGDYQLVFKMFDRAGYPMKFDLAKAQNDFTFTSLNPLLVQEVKDEKDITTIYIDGVAYGAIEVVGGLQKKYGGVTVIRAISNKTGKQTDYDLRVVSEQVLDVFTIIEPSDVVARNDKEGKATAITLEYQAFDVNGDPVTDFRALYQAVSLSHDDFRLEENNDGTARLKYYLDVADVKPAADYDTPVIVTAIVPRSGKSTNTTLDIKLDRIASQVSKFSGSTKALLEGTSLTLDLGHENYCWNYHNGGSIEFADQYGVQIQSDNLFRSTKDVKDDKIDYAGGKLIEERYVGVKIEGGAGLIATGSSLKMPLLDEDGKEVKDDKGETVLTDLKIDDYVIFNPYKGDLLTLVAGNQVTETIKEFPVEIILYDAIEKEFIGGSELVVTYKVADLSQVVSMWVGVGDNLIENGVHNHYNADGTPAADYSWCSVDGALADGNNVQISAFNNLDKKLNIEGMPVVVFEQKLRDYNLVLEEAGTAPKFESTAAVTGSYLKLDIAGADKISVEDNALLFKDQSKQLADGQYADRNLVFDVTATVYTYSAKGDKLKGTVKTAIEVGNYKRDVNRFQFKSWMPWINQFTDAYVNANDGVITYGMLRDYLEKAFDNYNDEYTNLNNVAGKPVKVTITNVKEGSVGLRYQDIVLKASTATVNFDAKQPDVTMIEEAEIGDTFTVTYTVEGQSVSSTVNFVVGGDTTAWFNDAGTELKFN